MPTPVVIATGNAHKAEEIQALLGPDFVCRTLADFPDAPEVEETARTLAGNAALKAPFPRQLAQAKRGLARRLGARR